MALPREPRQKMINMMYLVLTALLALNVSAEILNAFSTIDQGIDHSNKTIDAKNQDEMAAFQRAIGEQGLAKVGPFQQRAEAAFDSANNAVKYVDSLKLAIKFASEGKKPDGAKYNIDYMDGTTEVMDNNGGGNGLYRRIVTLRDHLLNLLSDTAAERSAYKLSIPLKIDNPIVENKGNRGWVGAHFRMVPAIAAITMLDKYENDMRASANAIIEENYSHINAKDIKLDQFKAFISPNSLYLMNGEAFKAEIGVRAFSSAVHPDVTVNGQPLQVGTDGTADFSETSGVGTHTVMVKIDMKRPDGTLEHMEQPITYTVGSSSLTVATELTKVVFREINNPIAVSAGGVNAEDLSVSASGGQLSRTGPGKYNLMPGDGSECVINVSAKLPDGTNKNMGVEKFLIKDLPNPTVYVGTSDGGRMRAAEFRANSGLRAAFGPDLSFISGVNFRVTSYTMYAVGGPELQTMVQGDGTSYLFAQVQSIINRCKPGTIVSFDDIRAVGPTGKSRKLKEVAFTLY